MVGEPFDPSTTLTDGAPRAGIARPYSYGKMLDKISGQTLNKIRRGGFTDEFCHSQIIFINPPPPN
ncbi:MAG: hypothetical protein EAZ98_06080 [Oscillatoriales cyanobacterium]|nr:MAG: hypothetical protein EAZ98_06080 [Oscillatoriales cyanobacterium]